MIVIYFVLLLVGVASIPIMGRVGIAIIPRRSNGRYEKGRYEKCRREIDKRDIIRAEEAKLYRLQMLEKCKRVDEMLCPNNSDVCVVPFNHYAAITNEGLFGALEYRKKECEVFEKNERFANIYGKIVLFFLILFFIFMLLFIMT